MRKNYHMVDQLEHRVYNGVLVIDHDHQTEGTMRHARIKWKAMTRVEIHK